MAPRELTPDDLKLIEDADANNAHIDHSECSICMMPFEGESSVYPYALMMQSQCLHHKFHQECIRIWLQQSHKCPMCRQ
jgi:hypothetical protein